MIERIQRLAVRCVRRFRRLPYSASFCELKIPSIQRHSLRATRKTIYRLFHDYLNLFAGNSLNHQLQVTSEGTTLRSVNHVFILPDGKRLLLFVRPDSGIDRHHTSLKLRQCPISRIAWMPTGAPSSLTLFHTTPFLCTWFW